MAAVLLQHIIGTNYFVLSHVLVEISKTVLIFGSKSGGDFLWFNKCSSSNRLAGLVNLISVRDLETWRHLHEQISLATQKSATSHTETYRLQSSIL